MPEDYASACIEIWPDNELTVEVFQMLDTQWRSGMGGPTGLDYGALPVIYDTLEIAPHERRGLFAGLRVMEREALDAIHGVS